MSIVILILFIILVVLLSFVFIDKVDIWDKIALTYNNHKTYNYIG